MKENLYVDRFYCHVHDIPGDRLENAMDMIVKTFKWRLAEKVNDIKSEDIPQGMKDVGSLYLHNRDTEGKQLLVFDVKKHVKGAFKTEEMHRAFIYFLERIDRYCKSLVS